MKKARRVMIALFLMAVLCTQLAMNALAVSGSYIWYDTNGAQFTAKVTRGSSSIYNWLIDGSTKHHTSGTETTITLSGVKSKYRTSINSSSQFDTEVKKATQATPGMNSSTTFYVNFGSGTPFTVPASYPSGNYCVAVDITQYAGTFTVKKLENGTLTQEDFGTVSNAPSSAGSAYKFAL